MCTTLTYTTLLTSLPPGLGPGRFTFRILLPARFAYVYFHPPPNSGIKSQINAKSYLPSPCGSGVEWTTRVGTGTAQAVNAGRCAARPWHCFGAGAGRAGPGPRGGAAGRGARWVGNFFFYRTINVNKI